MPYRYFIQLSFDGTGFAGWQIQPNALTVQEVLEQALDTLTGVKQKVTGCGRTDAGVHASRFFAHFDSEISYTRQDLILLTNRLNRYLPPSVTLYTIRPVHSGTHSRFSALKREYKYRIARHKDPFIRDWSYFIYGQLDIDAMNRAALHLTGCHNFQAFSKTRTQVKSFICNVFEATWKEEGNELVFTIAADRFLRNMVRAIVGTLLDVGRGKLSEEAFLKILDAKDRTKAGTSVPARALFLTAVDYPEDIYTNEPEWFSEDCPEEIKSHDEADTEFHSRSGNKTYE